MTHPGRERPAVLPEPMRDEYGEALPHEFENDIPLMAFEATVTWRPDYATQTKMYHAINKHYYGHEQVPLTEGALTVDHRQAAYNVPRGLAQVVNVTLYSSGRCTFECR